MDVNRAARNRCLAAACSVLAVLSIASAAVAASGDSAAISVFKQSRAAMAAYEGIAFHGRGTSYRVVHETGGNGFKVDFGATPKGYSAAVAHVRVVQRHGVITEEVDTLIAPGKPTLRLWQTRGTEIGELLTAKPCPELVPTNSASFVTLGVRFVTLNGTFAPLAPQGAALTLVTRGFPLAGGVARESDTIDLATHLWQASHLVIAGGPFDRDFLDESGFRYSRSQRFLNPPALQKCT